MTLALQGAGSTACTEHDLVAAVRRGDDRAFELLFSRYERRITAYVMSMVGDHARAEDITQDVFISALRRIRETQRPIAFRPWIYEIAKNACIDEFRRARRNQEISLEEGEGSSFAARNVSVHAPPPQAAIESKQRLDDLCGAFGGLSESHHRVLVLRELEGLSYAEIGERLGMTRAMVESTLFRARRRLSEEYDELASGRRCARVQSLIDARAAEPLASLGMRDRRALTRHLAHCEPCRRWARIDGVDDGVLTPRRRMAKLAALLPLPLLRWRRGPSSNDVATQSGSHSIAVAQSLQNVTQLVDPSGPSAALGRAVAAAAAVAGAGSGMVANLGVPVTRSAAPPATTGAAPAVSASPVLSFTKILTPSGSASSKAAVGYPAVLVVLGGVGRVAAGASPTAGFGGPVLGPVQTYGGGATGEPGGSSGAGGGSTVAGAGTGGSGSGGSSGSSVDGTSSASGNSSGTRSSVPSGIAPGGSSGPGTPQVPLPPSGAPSVGSPQQPSEPTGDGQAVQVPDSSTVQSTAQSTTTTATQTVQQVQQSAPTAPTNVATSPPPGS